MAKEIAIQKYDISNPARVAAMANVLKAHVVKQKLFTNIGGKNYAHVEGWQFAGGLMGMIPRVKRIENLSTGTEKKWLAEVEIVDMKTGEFRGAGFALCSNLESKKKSFDEYAVLSMAQTRAIGKAYRNLIGWVMKVAGYEGTPSEEMTKVGQTPEQVQEETVIQMPVDYTCSRKNCGEEISKQVADYSKKIYGKSLCREHQKEATPITKK